MVTPAPTDRKPRIDDSVTIWDGQRARDRILALIEERRQATRREIMHALGIDENSLQSCIAALRNDGCVHIAGCVDNGTPNKAHLYAPVP